MGILGFLGEKTQKFSGPEGRNKSIPINISPREWMYSTYLQRQNKATGICGLMMSQLWPTSPEGGSLPWVHPWRPSSSFLSRSRTELDANKNQPWGSSLSHHPPCLPPHYCWSRLLSSSSAFPYPNLISILGMLYVGLPPLP